MGTPHATSDWRGRALAALPEDRPFRRGEAVRLGVPERQLTDLVTSGWLVRPLAGVYHREALRDSLELRLACLRLVVPDDAVVTDRTAAWLWGATMVLAPHDDLRPPRVSLFRPPGYRLRNGLTVSGSRDLPTRDVEERAGVRVTTPLRTACDLGRLLTRDQAIAALDALARDAGVHVAELREEATRFRGYRGVRQLRALAPLVDPRSQSPGESILRLRWLDCGDMPAPESQLEVPGEAHSLFLDLGLWRPRFAAEYDGAAWHGADRAEHDERRRRWITRELGFTLQVFRSQDLRGPQERVQHALRAGFAEAQRLAHRPAYWINDWSA